MVCYPRFCRWCRICYLSFRKRWRTDWGGDWWSAEGTPRRCYQTPGIASCGLQSGVSEAVHGRSRNWEQREQVFDDGNINVQMRSLLVLFIIGSEFHPIFAFQINSSPILLPLLCMPLGIIRLFVCVVPSVRWKGSVAESSNELPLFALDL